MTFLNQIELKRPKATPSRGPPPADLAKLIKTPYNVTGAAFA